MTGKNSGKKQRPPVKRTTLCHIERGGEWLMLHRTKKENDLNGGKWIGVGGKLEPGETPDECAVRETFEETGLTLTSFRRAGVIHFILPKWGDEDSYLYLADGFTGELRNDCDEGELAWIPKEDVMSLRLWEGDKAFLPLLLRGETDIEMTLVYDADDNLLEVREGREEDR